MENYSYKISKIPVMINFSHFCGKSDIDEYHLVFIPEKYENFENQIKWVYTAYKETLKYIGLDEKTSVFKRFYCSDLFNQAIYLKNKNLFNFSNCGTSYICQPPGPWGKVALWSYHIKDKLNKTNKKLKNNNFSLKRGNIIHNLTTGITYPEGKTVYEQTTGVLKKYNNFLSKNKMTLLNNVIRTWFFIQNIDLNYKEFVDARKEFYAQNGLTKDTHFIASTGVEGKYFNSDVKVVMDAYSISGILKEQIEYLSAPEHLGPTYLYGVTFERGVTISYKDRKHIIISGTASINNKGEILYHGDITKQLERCLENIKALLEKANAQLNDISLLVVYIRDPSDYTIVEKKIRKKFSDTPLIICYASVCRPGWLVEIECFATIPLSTSVFYC